MGGEGLHSDDVPHHRPPSGLVYDVMCGLWKWLASHFDTRRLVFIDESGFSISMMRLRARAPKGKRAYGRVPTNRGKNQTLIASMSLQGGMGVAMRRWRELPTR